jgi:uncharacterized integral membrane protein
MLASRPVMVRASHAAWTVAVLGVLVVVLGALLVLVLVNTEQLRAHVDAACSGPAASLDLSAFVPLCRDYGRSDPP